MNSTEPKTNCVLPLYQSDIKELYKVFIADAVLMFLFSPPTIVLNLLVLVGIYKTPSLHSPSNILLCGLALTDLGAGAIALPMFAIFSIGYALNATHLLCYMDILTKLLVTPFSGISFVTMTLISLDRMIALMFHMKYYCIVTTRRVLIAVIFSWCSAYVIASSHLWYIELIRWSTVIIFIACFVVCTVNNAVIFRILKYHRTQIARQQKQVQANENINNSIEAQQKRKTSSNALWIYLLFILCYAPFLIARVMKNYLDTKTKTVYLLFNTAYVIMYLNSLLNPIVYCIKMRPIRNAVVRLVPEQLLFLLRARRSINNNQAQPGCMVKNTNAFS